MWCLVTMPDSPGTRRSPSMRTEESSGDRPLAALGQGATLRSEPSVAGFVETRMKSQGGPYLASDRFVEGEVIGRGGTSIVIRAFDKNILRDVAVKVLAPEAEDGGVELERFAEEARIAGQLEHPNILPVYEFGLDQRGKRFLCMRLVEGKTLEQALDLAGNTRFSPGRLAEFLQIFVKVCDAVSFAHSRGVIHRDLKPTNIMISEFGQVYVLDWGIARLLPPDTDRGPSVRPRPGDAERAELDAPGALIGTACYMAPEQIRGHHDALDERTDVFALGATLYQILTGKPPLTPDIVRAIWTRKPAPPIAPPDAHVPAGGVPPDLSRIALRATAYDPAGRHESVAALKREVEAFQRGAWDFPRTKVPAGFVIVAEGDPGRAAYVILEGRCVAYRVEGDAEIELRIMEAGDVFGETAVFTDKPRTASVRAATDCLLLVVTSEVLSSAVGLNSWMGAFVKALADRFREADERLRTLERPHPRRGSGPDSTTG
jgi:tRNA A-37 threonylcarbamoyl transferase component Bud32